MPLRRIYIDRQIQQAPETRALLSNIDLPTSVVTGAAEVYAAVQAAPDPIAFGKQVLYLTRNQGAFVRDCPGTSDYLCCGYRILHVGTFCHMDCSYCILQAYFHPPVMQYFVNHEDLFAELAGLFRSGEVQRIGTGEFTDSLIWERWTGLSRKLVPVFGRQNSAVLELKTKTTAVTNLRGLAHRRKSIAAWSLNTPRVIAAEEKRTAALQARLEAAARCESWGYPVAFHFDPIVIYEGCEADYRDVIEQMYAAVSAQNIVWISLGSFRFMPSLKPIVAHRFQESKLIYGEFVPGRDGKMRYFKPLRIEVYRAIVSAIREIDPGAPVYFCMEDDEVWQETLGFKPDDRGGVSQILDERAIECCGLAAGKGES
jgi:spore photoproduct lyase